MASFDLTRLDRFPEGTSVSIYDASGYDAWPGSPPGAVVQTKTMGATSATFTGLVPGRRYFVYASSNGAHASLTAPDENENVAGPGAVVYADANNGSDDNSGESWDTAKLTIAGGLAVLSEGDELHITGKFREQIASDYLLGGISIIGHSNRPRHSDSPWPSGAAWLPPLSPAATTPLLKISAQGWRLENIMFDGPTDAASVHLDRTAESPGPEHDASHLIVRGCRFVTGNTGIKDVGGAYNVLVEDCTFHLIQDGTGRAIWCDTAAAVTYPGLWNIRNCRFIDNDNHIVAAASKWFVHDNIFSADGVSKGIDFTGGVEGNIVTKNLLGGTYGASLYVVAGAADEWGGNFNSLSGGVTAADPA